MILPAIPHAERYAGLFIYDFGTHVSVGYTAQEIRILRESKRHRNGTAYQIYRVADNGTIELRGVLDERLTAREAVCFLRHVGASARNDYDTLRAAAEQSPVPCAVGLCLARLHAFTPPDLTALLYPAPASAVVAAWLERVGFQGGDQVVGGIDVHAAVSTSDGIRIAACNLPTMLAYEDRPSEEVFRTIHEPLQR